MLSRSRQSRHGAVFFTPALLAAVVAGGACLAAFLVAGSSLGSGVAQAQAQASPFTVIVTITNSELRLVPSTVPAGGVVFMVVNKAKSTRDFEVAGKQTPMIGAGKSATLRAVVAQRPYRYVSVGPGHAPLTGFLGVLKACANPTSSTVEVEITVGVIMLSESTVPCGTVTFVVTNKEVPGSQDVHRFEVFVPTNAKTGLSPLLHAGETAKMTIDIPIKAKVYYDDGVGRNNELGGAGSLIVD
jgi:hypothetical protein